VTGLLLAVLATYANHFENGFHFDDFHTITTNVYVADWRNIPRFFTDGTLFTREPANASYRPLTSASLAVDYWLGHGFQPFYFHLSTVFWFELQALFIFLLFRRIMNLTDPDSGGINDWTALGAAACYGLHPANAETVNYIIQRADLYSTLGVVASLLWFVAYPAQRKWGWYLIPALAAYLSKAPALVFPLILLVYVWLFEPENLRKGGLRLLAPPFLVTAGAAILTARMTPATFDPSAASGALYRWTQPWVALHYFKSFFLPTELSVNGDWPYVAPFSGEALAGIGFVLSLGAAAFYCARSRELRPIAFGLLWFLLALAPTSLMPLEEVANDHRMFFPFVGLALAVVWSLRSASFLKKVPLRATVLMTVAVLCAEAAGTHERNEVWRTEATLWRDATLKNPKSGVSLLTYGGTFLENGDYATALSYFEQAAAYIPNHWVLHSNEGIADAALGRDAEAEQHFRRAIQLAPGEADPYYIYGRWLNQKGRTAESQTQLEAAIRANPLSFPARYLLLETYSAQGNRTAYDALYRERLQLAGNDPAARQGLESRPPDSAEALLHQSAEYCRAGRFEECIAAARKAIALKPDYAEAYNNIAASYIALHRPDEGVQAATEAVRLRPDWELAKKNLQRALALSQAGKQGGGR
jgi:tetratricopeptide (TPR) repeat protein